MPPERWEAGRVVLWTGCSLILFYLALPILIIFSKVHLVGKPMGLYLGHTVIATPLVVVIVSSALRAYDRSIEQAARSLGAGYFRAVWHVTLPLIRPAILSAAAFAFLASFGEVIVSIFLGGPGATTLPKKSRMATARKL